MNSNLPKASYPWICPDNISILMNRGLQIPQINNIGITYPDERGDYKSWAVERLYCPYYQIVK